MADDDQIEQEEAPERPAWLPDKFDSPEAFASAYNELNSAYGRQGQELGELRSDMDSLTAMIEEQAQNQQPYQPYQPDPNEHPLVQRLNYARETGNTAEELRVQAEFFNALMKENTPAPPEPQQPDWTLTTTFAENQIRAANPDYDNYRDKTVEILQANPQLIPEGSDLNTVQNGILNALQIARGQAAFDQYQKDQQQAAQAEADRQAKLQAQTLQGSGTRPETVTEASQIWERIRNADTGSFRLPS